MKEEELEVNRRKNQEDWIYEALNYRQDIGCDYVDSLPIDWPTPPGDLEEKLSEGLELREKPEWIESLFWTVAKSFGKVRMKYIRLWAWYGSDEVWRKGVPIQRYVKSGRGAPTWFLERVEAKKREVESDGVSVLEDLG